MKLYISGDMEGVAGVSAWQQVDARGPHPEYAIFRRYYTKEIGAAIDGAREAGAAEIVVNDSHGPMRNLLLDELPDDVRVIFGNRKPHSMVHGAGSEFGGAFFIGYHGGAGAQDAVLCHTYTPSVVYEVRVNGIECSEGTINAALLGALGVPVLLVSGDRTTVESLQAQLPWVRGAIVKESIGAFAANSLSPANARALIAKAARDAVANASEVKPYIIDPPLNLDLTLVTAAQADLVATIPGFVRTAGRRVRFEHDEFAVLFRAFVAAWRMGSLAPGYGSPRR
ncbi:MAG: M55 family metallopeptidase [Candidatus Tyrphobacter sp.]